MRESRYQLVAWLLFLFFLLLMAMLLAPTVATVSIEVLSTDRPLDPGPTDISDSIFIPFVLNSAEIGTEQPPQEKPGDPGDPEEPGEQATGFEIDGNSKWDEVGSIDWETTNFPPAIHIQDPHSKSARDTTVFKPNGKFDKPESWRISQGSVGAPQTELTNLLTWFVKKGELGPNTPSSAWLLLAMERTKTEGTFYLDFEYNQFVVSD